jgi:hypothetical protein
MRGEGTVRESIRALESRINDDRKVLEDRRQQLAEMTCPYRVGEITETKGYTHKGKRCVITKIKPGKFASRGDWEVEFTQINVNGKPGLSHGSWDQTEEECVARFNKKLAESL